MAQFGRKKLAMPDKVHGVRNQDDWYPTPARLAVKLMELIDFKPGDVLLEPAKGKKGNCPFYDAMPEDHEKLWAEIDEGVDYFSHDFSADVITGNPPFNLAEDFIKKAVSELKPGGMVVFLLRLNYLGSEKRYKTMWQNPELVPKAVITLVERPSFSGDNKTDATEYAFFCFGDISRLKNQEPFQWLSWFTRPPRRKPQKRKAAKKAA